MQNSTVKTVGVVMVVLGALAAMAGAFIPDVHLGGSASGGTGTAEGTVSVGFGGLLWGGVLVMAVGLALTLGAMFADKPRPREPRPDEAE